MTEQRVKAHRRRINQSGAEMNVITAPDGTNRICERASIAARHRLHTRLILKSFVAMIKREHVRIVNFKRILKSFNVHLQTI